MTTKELTAAERAISYSKYFDLPVEMPTADEERALRSPMNEKDAISCPDMLDAFSVVGNPASENRYCMFPDGSGYADMMIELPDCTGDMLGWWFSWFMFPPDGIPEECGNLKYKIWDPLDHWDTRGPYVVESFDDGAGDPKWKTHHGSLKPCEYGLSDEKVAELKSKNVIFGCSVNTTEGMANRIGMNLHQPREGGGFITRARYWFGWTMRDGKPVRDMSGEQYSEETVRKILRHNMIEKRRLNTLLPLIFPEEGAKR